ncbi:MAG TPA: 4Fe-4S cluster-binding domain-containing protein [Bacteroidales bacterium]|nr:4Fe-4S cluster-binding domain-containing protein [Smithella sp.]HOU97159.1 4Fe-4S cluster-binding domain-containing protein [Bacteroidales bacterium]HNY49114.1 4Fe-4S cluster-binding domain-containing protein [Smithella sp.]HOG90436.1 4Fe-4S cluster-binding domain-containing protein [Smithella sp.]HQG65866.1 4Fe-4S cluster-binding domain-containing protein [Smithella sp.]
MIKRIRNYLKKFIPALGKTSNYELQKPEEVTKCTPKAMKYFGVPLVEHCNLRCCGCDHFAPLAEKEFTKMDVFENDFARMSYLMQGEVERIGLMGGEPLLHPQVKDCLSIARKYFQKSRIRIVTNGVLLLKQKEDFWKSCRENNIIIEVTKYPINLDFDKMKEVAGRHDVLLTFRDNTGEVQKTSYHIPLDLNGEQDIPRNFVKCFHANHTIFLKGGRLYTCTIAPNIVHFNKFFNRDLPTSDSNSIDIHQAQSAQEIFEFLSKPIPLCRYCYVEKRTFGHPWTRSRKEIKEWTV